MDSYQSVEQQLADSEIEDYLKELLAAYSHYFYHKESRKVRSRSIFIADPSLFKRNSL
ncbi:hypothetical protein [Ignatzschineria indica]|uniref:hypothetical protein n=1 Tax=Ignatzschineria indica TaxID=472583 RepID=UPI001300A2F3|nr:hypothetical protein [Ignatzschineria indica]